MIGQGDYAYTVPFYGERRPQLMDLVFEDSAETAARYPAITRRGDTLTTEVFCNALYSGRGAWVFAKASPLYDASGKIIGAIEIIRDVTERKQAEEALKKLSLRQEALLTAIPDILMEVDANKVYTWANPAGYEFFGHDVIGREASCFFEGDQDTYSMVQPLFKGDESVIYLESWQRRKDGEKRLLAWWCRVLKDGSGCIVGVLSTARDITEQKRAEEALRRSEKDLRESQRIAHVGSWRLDVGTNQVVWTEELYNMYGFDPSLPPPPYTEHMKLFTPESWDRLSKALARTRDTGIPYTLELETVRKDGCNGWMWVHGQADVDSAGKTVGLWGAAQDITERKRAEEENRLLQERLNRSEKMESLGMLAGGVAHDLNNVLGVVLGYSELLASSLDTSSPLQSQIEKIMKGTERAAEIVQDLLTLARRGVLTRSAVSINDVIMNFLKSPEYERILLCNPRMRVNADLQADILNMMGSKIHLHKTMMNLVSNASDAMPDGGCLNIKTSNQYLDRAISGYDHVREGDYVVLSVSDTGEGISSDDIRHIFEPFYTKKVMGRSGTGLGLAVVWGTVKDHEGYIDVQSEMGKGTTFDLYFPVTREMVSDEKIPVSLSDYMGKGESVLVIDDVKGQRDLASEMLSRLNYKVASVPSGEAAVEYLKENRADILVLDMIMDPGMDGLDTYKEILKLYPGQKAVIVSGFSETDRVRKAHRLGAGAYVRKPYAMERLGLAVRRELDKK
jgi:PAS domain S-box-containing protein